MPLFLRLFPAYLLELRLQLSDAHLWASRVREGTSSADGSAAGGASLHGYEKLRRRARTLRIFPPMPGPQAYSPKATADGKEFDMAELSGAERMAMSAFTSKTPARAPPDNWADPIRCWMTNL